VDIKKSIILNLRWHRRIGLSVFVVMIFLAITGFALNHSPGLSLSKINLTNSWLLSWYGVAPQKSEGYAAADNWVYGSGSEQLYFNDQALGYCPPPLASVAITEQLIIALCSGSLSILTPEGLLVETFNQVQGLPANSTGLVTIGETVMLLGGEMAWEFDPELLNLSAIDDLSILNQATILQPDNLPNAYNNNDNSGGISLETVIVDLHSGRFFGDAGVLFVDIVGLLICLLAFTGLWAWVNHQRLRKQ
jgi:hypothetical protein